MIVYVIIKIWIIAKFKEKKKLMNRGPKLLI